MHPYYVYSYYYIVYPWLKAWTSSSLPSYFRLQPSYQAPPPGRPTPTSTQVPVKQLRLGSCHQLPIPIGLADVQLLRVEISKLPIHRLHISSEGNSGNDRLWAVPTLVPLPAAGFLLQHNQHQLDIFRLHRHQLRPDHLPAALQLPGCPELTYHILFRISRYHMYPSNYS